MTFKVGQTIQSLGQLKPSHIISMANLLGFEHLELDPTVFDDIEAVLPLVQKKSVILHAPYYFDWGFDLSSKKQSEKVEKYMDNLKTYANALGALGIVVHPPMDPDKDEEYFLKNLDRIKIMVLLENLPGLKLEDFKTWYLSTKSKTKANVGICFDVPHSFLTHGKEDLFNIPEILLPDIHYIHISELTHDSDCHWPFGTEGGELPLDLFEKFLKNIQFNGTINMELMPSGLKGIENLIDSYLILKKFGPKLPYLLKKIRILLLKPLLMKKLKNVPLQAEPDKHNYSAP